MRRDWARVLDLRPVRGLDVECGTGIEGQGNGQILLIFESNQSSMPTERAGYYHVDVTGERTASITRRGGRATVTP